MKKIATIAVLALLAGCKYEPPPDATATYSPDGVPMYFTQCSVYHDDDAKSCLIIAGRQCTTKGYTVVSKQLVNGFRSSWIDMSFTCGKPK